jgi:hypothetical protein
VEEKSLRSPIFQWVWNSNTPARRRVPDPQVDLLLGARIPHRELVEVKHAGVDGRAGGAAGPGTRGTRPTCRRWPAGRRVHQRQRRAGRARRNGRRRGREKRTGLIWSIMARSNDRQHRQFVSEEQREPASPPRDSQVATAAASEFNGLAQRRIPSPPATWPGPLLLLGVQRYYASFNG